MALPDIFTKEVSEGLISRIQKLTPESPAQWGKMNVSQMLAHCNVTYEYIYDNKHKKPKGITKIILKLLVKPLVVNEKPYKQSNPTAPDFRIVDERDFLLERERLMGFIRRVQCDGAAHFDGKDSHSFGKLSKTEWNNMFYKHLNHHLTQFGV